MFSSLVSHIILPSLSEREQTEAEVAVFLYQPCSTTSNLRSTQRRSYTLLPHAYFCVPLCTHLSCLKAAERELAARARSHQTSFVPTPNSTVLYKPARQPTLRQEDGTGNGFHDYLASFCDVEKKENEIGTRLLISLK